MLPDDGFWAAKQVMAFTEPEVRAIVKLAEYSSEAGNEYLIQSLMKRREKIGRTYFAMVLPLDNFEVDNGHLRFDDLAVKNGFHTPRTYQYEWSTFDNESGGRSPIPGTSSDSLPSIPGGYAVVQIVAEDRKKSVDVYVRSTGGKPEVVGIERHW
jgi:hypothetical protein